MKINFNIKDRFNPIISIRGYLDDYDCSDYCMTFYDSFNNFHVRIPENPFTWYSNNYYDYIDLIYHFECDEEFLDVIKEFAVSEDRDILLQRRGYDLILKKEVI